MKNATSGNPVTVWHGGSDNEMSHATQIPSSRRTPSPLPRYSTVGHREVRFDRDPPSRPPYQSPPPSGVPIALLRNPTPPAYCPLLNVMQVAMLMAPSTLVQHATAHRCKEYECVTISTPTSRIWTCKPCRLHGKLGGRQPTTAIQPEPVGLLQFPDTG